MTNNKQQTAVDWLWEIAYNRELTIEDWKQAKAMHKEEIIIARSTGLPIEDGVFTAIDKAHKYYNETYGGGEQ